MIDFDAISRKIEEVRRRENAVARLRARATDTSVKLSNMPRGGGDGKAMERDVVSLVDAQRDCDKAKAELKVMRSELRRAMRVLRDWQHIDVIRKHYIEGKNFQQIMLEIGYEEAQTRRFMKAAREIINGSKDDSA